MSGAAPSAHFIELSEPSGANDLRFITLRKPDLVRRSYEYKPRRSTGHRSRCRPAALPKAFAMPSSDGIHIEIKRYMLPFHSRLRAWRLHGCAGSGDPWKKGRDLLHRFDFKHFEPGRHRYRFQKVDVIFTSLGASQEKHFRAPHGPSSSPGMPFKRSLRVFGSRPQTCKIESPMSQRIGAHVPLCWSLPSCLEVTEVGAQLPL